MTITRWPSGHTISRRLRILAVGLCVALVLIACADQESPNPTQSESEESITVASFDFSENWILAEIYGQAIRRAGIPVQMLSNVGTREVVGPALEQGQVDFVVDYLGSALEAADLGNPATHGSLEYARRELQKALVGSGVVVLSAAAAQDQNGFAVTRETARWTVIAHHQRPFADCIVHGVRRTAGMPRPSLLPHRPSIGVRTALRAR